MDELLKMLSLRPTLKDRPPRKRRGPAEAGTVGGPRLWTVLPSDGRFTGVRLGNGKLCVPLFSSPQKAAAWIRERSDLNRSGVSPPLSPKSLVKFLKKAKEYDYELAAIDPPAEDGVTFEMGTLEGLLGQAKDLVEQEKNKRLDLYLKELAANNPPQPLRGVRPSMPRRRR